MASYSDYPEAVKNNARRVLKYVEENGWGSCGTEVGKQRANQLAKGEALSVDTIKRMYSYLSRHEVDLETSSSYEDGCGRLMYDAWGGKAALTWSRSKLRELGEIKEQDMAFLTKGYNEQLRDIDTEKRSVAGYFAVFGNTDLDGDIIERGAFTKSIKERGPEGKQLIKYLLDHDKTKAIGKLTKLEEDERGLYFEAKIGTHALGNDFIEMLKSEIINQASIGFKTVKEQYDQVTKANRIKEVMLYEGSSVTFLGANPEAGNTWFKSMDDALEYLAKMEKFIHNSSATDETLEKLETQLKSLLSQLKPASTTSNEIKADEKPIELKLSFESWKI
jgi:HK97 family phage prohead protease